MGVLETASSLNSGRTTVSCLCIIVASPFHFVLLHRALNNHRFIMSPHPDKVGCGEHHQWMVGQERASSTWSQTQAGCRILWHTGYIFITSCTTYDFHQTPQTAWWPKCNGLHIFLPQPPQSACSHLPSCPAWPPSLCHSAHRSQFSQCLSTCSCCISCSGGVHGSI